MAVLKNKKFKKSKKNWIKNLKKNKKIIFSVNKVKNFYYSSILASYLTN